MAGWTWPEQAFDLVVEDGAYLNCRLVEVNNEVVTVERDYVAVFGRILRLRTQVKVDLIRAIHEHAVMANTEGAHASEEPEAAARRRG